MPCFRAKVLILQNFVSLEVVWGDPVGSPHVKMETSLDALFVHVPKFSGYYRPYGNYMTVNLIPMGTWALADSAVQQGFNTRILHLGLEWIETGVFSALPYLKGKTVRVVAMPLHWHAQSYDVLKAAEEIKKERPDIFIVIGGFTASYFSKEIIKDYPQVDAVIRGDAEIPLPSLLGALKRGEDLCSVPNLTWRKDGEIKENPLSYVASEKELEAGSYANLRLLEKSSIYIQYMGMPFVWSKGISREMNRKYFHLGHNMFFLNVGRGCIGNCTWCGGGALAQKKISGRTGIIFRKPEKVVETIGEAAEAGYELIHMAFDPGEEAEKYYLGLFSMIRRNGIRTRCYFECFGRPSDTFLASFAKTFVRKGSVIAISPESGDEQIRRHNKTFFYTNRELMQSVSTAEGLGIRVDLFFAMGIPGESYSDLALTAGLRKKLRKRFKNIGRVWESIISLEPASPWFEQPTAYDIVSVRHTFADFYRASSPDGGGPGYYIPDFMGNGRNLDAAGFEKQLRETKCREHCSLHPNPRKSSSPIEGRIYCQYLNWTVGRHQWNA